MSTKRVATLALALGGALTMSGCGTQADIAATVNGTVISESAARTAAEQIRQNYPEEAAQFGTGDAVGILINAPFVLDALAASGRPVSEESARAQLKLVDDPSPETITLVRYENAVGQLQEGGQELIDGILEKLRSAKITVNPRYGTFDAQQVQIVPAAPNWIASGANAAG